MSSDAQDCGYSHARTVSSHATRGRTLASQVEPDSRLQRQRRRRAVGRRRRRRCLRGERRVRPRRWRRRGWSEELAPDEDGGCRVGARAVHRGWIGGMLAAGVLGTGGSARCAAGVGVDGEKRRERCMLLPACSRRPGRQNVARSFQWVGGGWSCAPFFTGISQGFTRSRFLLAVIESRRWTGALYLPAQRTYITRRPCRLSLAPSSNPILTLIAIHPNTPT